MERLGEFHAQVRAPVGQPHEEVRVYFSLDSQGDLWAQVERRDLYTGQVVDEGTVNLSAALRRASGNDGRGVPDNPNPPEPPSADQSVVAQRLAERRIRQSAKGSSLQICDPEKPRCRCSPGELLAFGCRCGGA